MHSSPTSLLPSSDVTEAVGPSRLRELVNGVGDSKAKPHRKTLSDGPIQILLVDLLYNETPYLKHDQHKAGALVDE